MKRIPVQTISAVQAVCTALENDIYAMNYQPGARIVEGDLVSRYCVSRNTIREAVAYLITSGLLIKEANKGIYVRKIQADDICEIFRLRVLLENEAIRLILANHTISDELAALAERTEQLNPLTQWEAHIETDIAFHKMLIDSTNSSRLIKLYDCILSEVKLCIYQSHIMVPAKIENIHQHREILLAMQRSDLESATRLMTQHIESAVAGYEAYFCSAC